MTTGDPFQDHPFFCVSHDWVFDSNVRGLIIALQQNSRHFGQRQQQSQNDSRFGGCFPADVGSAESAVLLQQPKHRGDGNEIAALHADNLQRSHRRTDQIKRQQVIGFSVCHVSCLFFKPLVESRAPAAKRGCTLQPVSVFECRGEYSLEGRRSLLTGALSPKGDPDQAESLDVDIGFFGTQVK